LDISTRPSFYVELPYPSGVSILEISEGEETRYAVDVSPNPPQVKVGQPGDGQPVTVAVLATWQASDADNETMLTPCFTAPIVAPPGNLWL
jgi:hypothetical protein